MRDNTEQYCIGHAKRHIGIGTVLAPEISKCALVKVVCCVPEEKVMLLWGCFHYFWIVTNIFGEFSPHLEGTLKEGDQNFS